MISLLYVARPAPQKGLKVLTGAMGFLKGYDVELNIVGDVTPQDQKYIRNVIPQEQKIHLHGAVVWKQVADIMRDNDILVVPSIYETFGNVAIEGMACGCVIVASKTGGLINLVDEGENGFLFKVGSSEHLAKMLKICIEDPLWIREAKLYSIEKSKRYSWEIVIEETLELFESLFR